MLEYLVRVRREYTSARYNSTWLYGNSENCNQPYRNYIIARRVAEKQIENILRQKTFSNDFLKAFKVEILSHDVPAWNLERIFIGNHDGLQSSIESTDLLPCEDPYLIRQYGI